MAASALAKPVAPKCGKASGTQTWQNQWHLQRRPHVVFRRPQFVIVRFIQ